MSESSNEQLEVEVPYVIAMLTCDVAITEAKTNKKTLVGIFDKIMVQEVPTVFRQFWLYAKLADLRGTHRVRIVVVHLDKEKKILEAAAETRSPTDSVNSFEFAMPIPEMPLPLTGAYEIQLYSDDIFIGRTVVTVIQPKATDPGGR